MVEDHRHEIYDVYGAAGENHQHAHVEHLIDGLRSDLNGAFERLSAVEMALAEHTAAMLDKLTP